MRRKKQKFVFAILGAFIIIALLYVAVQSPAVRNMLQGSVVTRGVTHDAWPLVCASSIDTVAFGDNHSFTPTVSADGRYIVYSSKAANLVPNDDNNVADIFLYDKNNGQIDRISVTSAGEQANGTSEAPTISADGQHIAFVSYATNLVPDDTNAVQDIFWHNRQTGTTTRISTAADGSNANGMSIQPRLAANGRYLTFSSSATNLAPNDDNNNPDIFVYDQETNSIELISVAPDGNIALSGSDSPDISADGRYVTFASVASNLVPDDTNGVYDIFVRDRTAGTTTRITVGADGAEGDNHSQVPRISDDGQRISYYSKASNLVATDTNDAFDVFVYDRGSNVTTLVSHAYNGDDAGNAHSLFHDISGNGRYITYMSLATNIIADDTNDATDIFLYDMNNATTTLISVNADGQQSNFAGDTSNFAGDSQAEINAYIDQLSTGKSSQEATAAVGGDGPNASPPNDLVRPAISATGAYIIYDSMATNLVPNDDNNARDIFVTNYTPAPDNQPTFNPTSFTYLPIIVSSN
ncbi:MAG TPA: hypothetical protein VLL52_08440 [Anaerolineae bacterium]|nr:hypothetical protein [Anaerolineae bacterium]